MRGSTQTSRRGAGCGSVSPKAMLIETPRASRGRGRAATSSVGAPPPPFRYQDTLNPCSSSSNESREKKQPAGPTSRAGRCDRQCSSRSYSVTPTAVSSRRASKRLIVSQVEPHGPLGELRPVATPACREEPGLRPDTLCRGRFELRDVGRGHRRGSFRIPGSRPQRPAGQDAHRRSRGRRAAARSTGAIQASS